VSTLDIVYLFWTYVSKYKKFNIKFKVEGLSETGNIGYNFSQWNSWSYKLLIFIKKKLSTRCKLKFILNE